MDWTFCCLRCGARSQQGTEDPRTLRILYHLYLPDLELLGTKAGARIDWPEEEIEPLFFLAKHRGHHIAVVSPDVGCLALDGGGISLKASVRWQERWGKRPES